MTTGSIVFHFNDLIDIAIVALIAYAIIGFVYKSKAAQLAKGALVFLAFYLAATAFRFRTVAWLMENVVQIGLLALVVILQPELRRALEEVGTADKWLGLFIHNRRMDSSLQGKWRSAIISICDAAETLSDSKTGALIVLQRRNSLENIIRTGTVVNSDVNAEMLQTIFYEGTPLHDGAVIIDNGEIRAAGCVLPLSNNLDFGRDMGTRHRAGLGIAENSDAIAIIVSEETGIISVAKKGVLIRHFDRQGLYSRLTDEILPEENTAEEEEKDKKIYRQFLNWLLNGGAKE